MSFSAIGEEPPYLTESPDTILVGTDPAPDLAAAPLASFITDYVEQDSLPNILGLAIYNAPIDSPPFTGTLDWQTDGGGGGDSSRPTTGLLYPRGQG